MLVLLYYLMCSSLFTAFNVLPVSTQVHYIVTIIVALLALLSLILTIYYSIVSGTPVSTSQIVSEVLDIINSTSNVQ